MGSGIVIEKACMCLSVHLTGGKFRGGNFPDEDLMITIHCLYICWTIKKMYAVGFVAHYRYVCLLLTCRLVKSASTQHAPPAANVTWHLVRERICALPERTFGTSTARDSKRQLASELVGWARKIVGFDAEGFCWKFSWVYVFVAFIVDSLAAVRCLLLIIS